MQKDPLVAILLCTYNGENFLEEQIESFLSQTHKNIQIWVSDDGSTDKTLDILAKYQKIIGPDRFFIIKANNKSSVKNFMSIVCNEDIEADYYCFADQDDIWHKDKIANGLKSLQKNGKNFSIYCTSTILIDENGKTIGHSPIFKEHPSFKNALVQSIAGGNTMLFNHSTAMLIRKAGPVETISHDWWLYMLVSGAGGNIIYDEMPSLLYRQHSNNVIGSNLGFFARAKRIRMLMNGRFSSWNDINTNSLQQVKILLTKKNREILDEFCAARKYGFFKRIKYLKKLGIYRQTLLGNLGLIAAALLGKL